MGRMGSRYMTTVVTWTVGVMGIIIFEAWGGSETRKGSSPPSSEAPPLNTINSTTDHGLRVAGELRRSHLAPIALGFGFFGVGSVS